MIRRSAHSLLLSGVAAALALVALPSLAQPSLRNTFPGRRVGGGTRGECFARPIVHLVPANSVFASGPSRLLGILEGPSLNPVSVAVSFRPEANRNAPATTVVLPASPAAVVLLRQPAITQPTRWESSYQCGGVQPGADDPLGYVSTVSPPPVSLLLNEGTPDDLRMQQSLQALLKACGSTVSRDQIAASFALTDLLKEGPWPERLPVLCPA
ncbi:MAG: hypothetical protein ACKO0M_05765 [Cyanobium sp.]